MLRRYTYIALITYLLVCGLALTASAHGSVASYTVLGIEKPNILPDSPLYFLKEFGRNIRFFFTFDPVKKAELELHIADERLAEIDELAEKPDVKTKDLARAIDNYISSHDRLARRLDSLRDKNKNIDALLEKLADRVSKHKELFANLQDELEKKDMDRIEERLNISAEAARKNWKASEKIEEKMKETQEKIRVAPKDEQPAACIQLFDPVCGVDGKTYSNSCFAGLAKVEVAHKGECRAEQPEQKEPAEKPAPPPASELPPVKPEPKTVQINIRNFAFSPSEIKISAGSTVNWTNQDSAGHTVTSDTGAFESGLLVQDMSFKRAFSEKGAFSYHCSPHPSMTGKIIVE